MGIGKKITPCPLCTGTEIEVFFKDKCRQYLCCNYCGLVFVPAKYWLTENEEKAVYDLHENNAEDEGYRKFLSRATVPLLERLGTKKSGLDFGCGPGPALSLMLEEYDHQVDLYDPFYYPDENVFKKNYDFIAATEVVEHLCYPGLELPRLFNILRAGGWLAIMTKLVIDKEAFANWHYIRDLTHICFYSRKTFNYLAELLGAEVDFVEKDVILLQKKS